MCNLTQNYVGKQSENSLILMTSKERFLNDEQSWPFLLKKNFLPSSMLLKGYILKL